MKTPLKTVFRPINALLAAALGLMASTLWLGATPPRVYSNAPHNLAERGPFYRVWQRTVPVTDSLTGKFTYELQQYTELGDGLCYLENGQWADSQDLIEITPNGAAAVRGPLKAYFSPNLNTVGAITLLDTSRPTAIPALRAPGAAAWINGYQSWSSCRVVDPRAAEVTGHWQMALLRGDGRTDRRTDGQSAGLGLAFGENDTGAGELRLERGRLVGEGKLPVDMILEGLRPQLRRDGGR